MTGTTNNLNKDLKSLNVESQQNKELLTMKNLKNFVLEYFLL